MTPGGMDDPARRPADEERRAMRGKEGSTMKPIRILIVGGVAGGASAATRDDIRTSERAAIR